MDFKSLTAKMVDLWNAAIQKAAPAFDKALDQAGKFTGEMLEKTADLSYDKIKNTPFYLKDATAFDAVSSTKNLVVFVAADKEDPATKAIIGRLPLLAAKAWQFSSSIKVVFAAENPDLVAALGAKPACVCIFREGKQKWMLEDEKLTTFLSTFDIFADWNAPLPTKTDDKSKESPVAEPAKDTATAAEDADTKSTPTT